MILSILQALLGLWNIVGGFYMSTHYEALITQGAMDALPSFFWIVLGVVQIVLGLCLLLSLGKQFKKCAYPSAAGLAIIALLGIGFYISYSGFPGMLWGILPALLLAFVAYKRA